ncbi:PLP-dependent aminotransferase family protein [Allokutzneria sp. A3M-2-11 16]|uniref:aminotransferase-like domain-containing protein n=1 Tax=Allokutzneria sp. A3M-2-11 16 TaxID=2962043 RepID=UPI0020B6A3FB|nr:PLP-dependent aminotransferase family protein [Allokutzneria sp. A3M-2-11 16]MCP3798061.1 PLP-dependent aminotransferase family protein [Allokutzneria sp. A3M-2-11 16]
MLPVELPIALDRTNPRPLAAQLADALRAAATTGHLRSGDRLPSTRALATHLKVSRTVTAAAYDQLHAEGWLDGKHGSGTFVTATPPAPGPGAVAAKPSAESGHGLDLAPGAGFGKGIETAAWRRAWRAAAEAEPLLRPQRAGLPSYRAAVAEHLLRHRGLVVPNAPEDAVLATAGTTAAVGELAMAVLPRGSAVAFEEPGYQRGVGAFRAAGLRVVPVPVDQDGLVVSEIPDEVVAVYCSPAHQYPLGGRLPATRRTQLIERARANAWLIVEDDYDGEMRYDVAPLPLLASLAPDVVVHLGTTSKILTVGLGTGWMVAPPEIAAKVIEHRNLTGTSPSAAGQRVLVELARHGDLGRHLRRLRRELGERRASLVLAFSEAGIPTVGDEAGGHLVVPMPSLEAERQALAEGQRHGLLLDGLERHHIGVPAWFGVAVGYTACTRRQLDGALPVLVDLLSRARAAPRTAEPAPSRPRAASPPAPR